MKIDKAREKCQAIQELAKQDKDGFIYCYFSHEDDAYTGGTFNMDKGEALIVIEQMLKDFDLDIEVLAMQFGKNKPKVEQH